MPGMTNTQTVGELPNWVRLVGIVVFALAAAQHLWHGRQVTGRQSWWHSGHAGMALAMVAMYWPGARALVPGRVGVTVFITAATLFLALAARAATGSGSPRSSPFTTLWTAAALDMAAMAYMYAMTSQTQVITYAFVLYFLIQAVVWTRRKRAGRPLAPASTHLPAEHLDRGSATSSLTWPPALRASQAGTAVAMAATLLIM
jgi:hypothetical protein